jgi:CBS domain-containing protein
MNTSVRHLLQKKGHDVWQTSPEATVYEALEFMAEKDIGALLVFEGDQLTGIISERDYARMAVSQGKTSKNTNVSEVMTEQVVCIQASQTVADCMALMTDKRIRHLPVLEDEKVSGVITIGDVVKEIISEQEFVIEQLENYITGSR